MENENAFTKEFPFGVSPLKTFLASVPRRVGFCRVGRQTAHRALELAYGGTFVLPLSHRGFFGGLDADQTHHAVIFMLEKMAVIDKRADGMGIAEVHANAHAGISEHSAVVIRHVDGIAEKRLIDWNSHVVHKHEMGLVNMKGMQFGR